MYSGNCSANLFPAITTPAACVAIFRLRPSSCKDKSKSFLTFLLFRTSSLNLGSRSIDSCKVKGLEGSKGTILQILST